VFSRGSLAALVLQSWCLRVGSWGSGWSRASTSGNRPLQPCGLLCRSSCFHLLSMWIQVPCHPLVSSALLSPEQKTPCNYFESEWMNWKWRGRSQFSARGWCWGAHHPTPIPLPSSSYPPCPHPQYMPAPLLSVPHPGVIGGEGSKALCFCYRVCANREGTQIPPYPAMRAALGRCSLLKGSQRWEAEAFWDLGWCGLTAQCHPSGGRIHWPISDPLVDLLSPCTTHPQSHTCSIPCGVLGAAGT
jgi:hypothetical protein